MKENNKPALMGVIITILSQLLMSMGHFVDIVPDSIINIVGVILTISVGILVFFTVRTLTQVTKSKNNSEKE